MSEALKTYDLEDRTARIGEDIIKFCKTVKQTTISAPIINQLVRAGTSVGANYMEANGASSKKDFRNKVFIAKKEIQESKHWLRMIALCIDGEHQTQELKRLRGEAQELTLIFGKIVSKLGH